ncbi:uncharacterized protein LOC134214248 [Armigeres subalbatus]|uniref:uncharacterized protein LOC134214248 n=1 Tax=Armigeres subalbatus TaxID=124917 RepID=UPI002ED33FA8
MKHWLTVVCVLGFLCGGVFTMYSAISIGSQGLGTMATSLKSIESVMKTYFKNLNAARNKILNSVDKFGLFVNTTYASLNDSYGATQPNIESFLSSVEWFSTQFTHIENSINSNIGYDLYKLNNEMQQTMTTIMQRCSNIDSLVSSFAYQQNGENCTEQISTKASNVPSQVSKFGACLQTAVEIVPTVVSPVQDILDLAKSDLISLNKQLKICAATSTSCINEYFSDIHAELLNVNMELFMANNLLNSFIYDTIWRNELCGELIKHNVQDVLQNLVTEFSQCSYPLN